jgi:hypothetical protein
VARELPPEVTAIATLLELGERVPLTMLRACMNSEDPEMLGIACTVLSEHAECIEGELLPVEVWPFYIRYYEKCIREDPEGEWSDSRYSAAHDLMRWYKYIRNRADVPQHYLDDVRRMLRTVYESGDKTVKRAVIDGALEHLFEDDSIIVEFDEWRTTPHLMAAYESALEWSKGVRNNSVTEIRKHRNVGGIC